MQILYDTLNFKFQQCTCDVNVMQVIVLVPLIFFYVHLLR